MLNVFKGWQKDEWKYSSSILAKPVMLSIGCKSLCTETKTNEMSAKHNSTDSDFLSVLISKEADLTQKQ